MFVFKKYIINIIICTAVLIVSETVSYVMQFEEGILSLFLGIYMFCISLKYAIKITKKRVLK